jgi:hypothetical protein
MRRGRHESGLKPIRLPPSAAGLTEVDLAKATPATLRRHEVDCQEAVDE